MRSNSSKINNLINDWAPLKELSNAKQKLQNKPWIIKRILKFIKNKNRQYKKICQTKDLNKHKKIEQEFKTYKNNLLKGYVRYILLVCFVCLKESTCETEKCFLFPFKSFFRS